MDERGWKYAPDGNYGIFQLICNKRIVGRLITQESEMKEIVRRLNAVEQAEAERDRLRVIVKCIRRGDFTAAEMTVEAMDAASLRERIEDA